MAAELGATTSRLLNKLAYDMANKASDVTLIASADLIPIYDASAEAMKYATPAEMRQANTNTTVIAAAGAAMTLPTGGGTTIIPLVTANATATLPVTPTLGLTYRFIYNGTSADAEDWVLTAAAFFKGGVVWLDEDSAGVEVAAVYGNGSTHTVFTVNNPNAGTDIWVIGDGTTWTITGTVVAADTPAFS
jgi:hypothetical protein